MFKLPLGSDAHLAHIEPHHAESLHALVQNSFDHIREWSNWLKDRDRKVEQTQEWIKKNQERYGAGDGYEIGIWYSGEMAGQIGYNYFNHADRRTEIGYWLGKEFQGKGLVTQACRQMLYHGFTTLGLNRIEINCATGNHKSQAIPERLGFTQEGILRKAELVNGQFHDLYLYSLLKQEWEKRS